MATVSATVVINAAFLREIKEDHVRFWELLRRTETLRMGQTGSFAEVLTELRDQLAMHFALEEAYGYFEDAVTEAPRLSSMADTLRGEHGKLFLNLCELVEQVERIAVRDDRGRVPDEVVADFDDFHRQFRLHESRENDLVQQAFHDDIGTGD